MPKRVLPLSDVKIRTANPGIKDGEKIEKDYKLADGKGLYLLVTLRGGKLWRLNYRYADKNKTLALGSYPEVSLAEARTFRDQARKLITKGLDPNEIKKLQKIEKAESDANTVESVSQDWLKRQEGVLAEVTRNMIKRRLDNDVFPSIGNTPIADLKGVDILNKVLRPIEKRGTLETAHRVRGVISQIMRYAVACGFCDRDATTDLRGALKPIQRKHHAALDADGVPDAGKVGGLLRAIEGFDGSSTVKAALLLHPLVATRPGELRHAEWHEIDFDTATWVIPAGRMKMKSPHIVPLSQQAMKILRELQPLTGNGQYLFPSTRSTARPISDNSMNAALRRMGYSSDEFVSHGWRAIFRTLADEVLQSRVDIIEAQLAHQVKDVLGRAYNRTSFLKERREMMQAWADYLDGLKSGAKVIPLFQKSK